MRSGPKFRVYAVLANLRRRGDNAGMDQIEVRFYGRLADRYGHSTWLPCGAEGMTVAAIRNQLSSTVSGLARARPVLGDSLVREDQQVCPGASIEFLPPVAGG
jgi:molybdopterin converting factor small subunit